MKRAVIAVCAAAMALATPVVASAEDKGYFYYDENGLVQIHGIIKNSFGDTKIKYPSNPFADDAPSFEDLARQEAEAYNKAHGLGNPNDPSELIEIDESEEDGIPLDHIYMFTRYEYTVVAVNPKMKRYMAKSVMNTNVKMRKNVIFTQDYVVSDKQLKIGDKIYLTFDEDESDGMTSDRQDFLVFAIPKEKYNSNLDFEVPVRVQNIFDENNVFVWGISKGVKM